MMTVRRISTFLYYLFLCSICFAIDSSHRLTTLDNSSNSGKRSVLLRKNTSLANQITLSNTIYVVQDVIELNSNVTVPANCILFFDGGSIKGDGIHTLNGEGTSIVAGLVPIFDSEVRLAGTWNVDKFDIRWFGVKSDDRAIDCTKIINKIKNCNNPIYFPQGTYYLSELYYQNKKGESLALIGEEPYGLSAKVNFMPFNNSQRYIIKIGGGANTFGGGGIGYNVKIMHINFTTPSGYVPHTLKNTYTISTSDYLNGGLILDAVEMGHFAISGSGIHNMPFLTFGYIYECEFDYVICYGNHGKSIQPAVQIVNSQNKPYSALHIKKMMGEVIVGPMIKTVGRCAGSELVIDNFYFEGTIRWEQESITSESRYSDLVNLSGSNVVPLFDLEGCGFTIINAELNMVNTKWVNKHDGKTIKSVRGLFKFNNTVCGVNILNLNNNGGSNWMYITGNALETYPIDVYIGQTNCMFQTDTKNINLIVDKKRIIDDGNPLFIESNKLYTDASLNDITIPFFIENRGTSNYIQHLKNERTSIETLYNSYLFNEYGFRLDTNMTCLFFEYLINKVSNSEIVIEYYDNTNKLLATENKDLIANKKVNQQVVTMNPPLKTSSFKIKYGSNSGFGMSIYKFGLFDCEHVPVKRMGHIRPGNALLTPGFRFFDTSIGKPVYWTGNTTIGDHGWVDALGNNPTNSLIETEKLKK